MSIKLSSLEGCFEGVVPSKMGTCALDGTPNASYLSHVHYVDETHVATSYQFFNKTRQNLLENPQAVLEVRHPANLKAYKLRIKYLRSEESGPIFDKMLVKLDVIAAYEGMGEVFKLKAADIYEVLSVEELPDRTTYHPVIECPQLEDLELVRVISDKMNRATNMEELLDLSLELLNRYLGWSHMMVLLADKADKKEGVLLTHASFGYDRGGAGSEVKWGEGLVGFVAERQRLYQISAIAEGFRYAKAAKGQTPSSSHEIPWPGLQRPASQMAAPIRANGEFWGVLLVEAEKKNYWYSRDALFLSTMTNLLGMGLSALAGKESSIRPSETIPAMPSTGKAWNFRFVEGDDVIFVNDQYLIKNIPARILRYLLDVYLKTGRLEFSNIELRTEASLKLPELKDNLETRLILLRKRLDEQPSGVRLVSIGRGRFKVEVAGTVNLI